MKNASLVAMLLSATPAWAAPAPVSVVEAAARRIDGASLMRHIRVLASDRFEGRAPGTEGERLTLAYLQQQFIDLGLAPGNPDGSYLQKVPLARVRSTPTLRYRAEQGAAVDLRFPDDFVAWSSQEGPVLDIAAAPLVFVGYGVSAPEYGWDDYKGVDLRGKMLLMLINDPPVTLPGEPARLDPMMFDGNAMTYYGRWTYKYEMAAKLGAAGALIVHETTPAGYPYDVVRTTWGRENFSIQNDGTPPILPAFPGWLELGRAKQLLRSAGHDFDTLKQAALSRAFTPMPLGLTASAGADNVWQRLDSYNVVARIEGADPRLKHETVIYSAHWDHFGLDDTLPGPRSQQIFHGARDNASGVAALLEVAKAYRALPHPPKRSILFLITTAEERGLLGAQYYARHPLYPLAKTLIDINVDGLNMWGRTRDVEIAGYGKSDADDIVTRQARLQGRVARPHSHPEFGSFYRSDHFEFAKVGVPVVYLSVGRDFIGQAAGFGKEKIERFTARDYHKVSDVVGPDWDSAGAVDDARLIFQIGYDVANGARYPQWKAGAEFKAVRDAMLPGAGQ
ncbi:MAG: M20/M25/M40 family metallo-hydrolase [Pseudomonadota bacterium]